ncbi:MAG: prepilin-type N-terminal cleavage/methylation domain-containing protein, partial [Candidatus Zixiibacteriota bacterium]
MKSTRGERTCAFVRGGFTLMEVVVATVLISAMLVSMLSFVQVAADNWRRTDQTINLTAELNTIDHYFTMQSLEALDISYPAVGVTSYTVKF